MAVVLPVVALCPAHRLVGPKTARFFVQRGSAGVIGAVAGHPRRQIIGVRVVVIGVRIVLVVLFLGVVGVAVALVVLVAIGLVVLVALVGVLVVAIDVAVGAVLMLGHLQVLLGLLDQFLVGHRRTAGGTTHRRVAAHQGGVTT